MRGREGWEGSEKMRDGITVWIENGWELYISISLGLRIIKILLFTRKPPSGEGKQTNKHCCCFQHRTHAAYVSSINYKE